MCFVVWCILFLKALLPVVSVVTVDLETTCVGTTLKRKINVAGQGGPVITSAFSSSDFNICNTPAQKVT